MPRSKDWVTFIERLGPDCAIGADDYQWLVLRAQGPAHPGRTDSWQDKTWRAVGFIANDKRALLQCIKDKGLKLSVAGKAALARQPDKIYRWQRAP